MLQSLHRTIAVFLLLSMVACQKEMLAPDVIRQQVAEGAMLRSVCFIDPAVGFVSGGEFEQQGYIYHTMDGGNTWQEVFTSGWSINAVRFLNSMEGYACGDSLHIIKTIDQGMTWQNVELSWYPYPEYVLPLKHIEFADDTTWYFTGGKDYLFGVNVRTQNGGSWWDMEVFQVELNTAYFKDEKQGLIAGYGVIYFTPDANVTFNPTSFSGDNITSLSFTDSFSGFASGFDGGIYHTPDGGNSWETLVKANGSLGSRIHFNAIEVADGSGAAVGNQGVMVYSEGSLMSWNTVDLGMEEDFQDILYLNGTYVVVGENGSFVKITF